MIKLSRAKTVACTECPFRAMKTFRKFTNDELRFVDALKIGEACITAGRTILAEGENSPQLFTVLSGWAIKYKALEDGRRQIINYALPGDFLGLQAAVFDNMHHSVEALSDTTLCVFPKDKIWTLYEKHPGLGFDVTWMAAQEKSILADFLVTVGQRTASERIAFLLLTLFRRARSAGLVRKNTVSFPFTQEHFADTIGFSLVHTNKSLNRLRRTGAFAWAGDTFVMLDEDALANLAGDPAAIAGPRPYI